MTKKALTADLWAEILEIERRYPTLNPYDVWSEFQRSLGHDPYDTNWDFMPKWFPTALREKRDQSRNPSSTYSPDSKYHQIIPEVKSIRVDGLRVRDMHEVRTVSPEVATRMDFSTPIEVSLFADGSLVINNGHHRVAAARQTGREYLPVTLQAINAKGRDIQHLIMESEQAPTQRNPRASRLDLRPGLRLLTHPIKLDTREVMALGELNRRFQNGDIQVYVGVVRDKVAYTVQDKQLTTGVEFVLCIDRQTNKYLAAPTEWVLAVTTMTATAIDRGMIPEPPEDVPPPPKYQKSAFGRGSKNPSAQKGSDTTQVATTAGSYRKAAQMLTDLVSKRPGAKVLDYGAGLGLGTEAMREELYGVAKVEGFEPLPGRAKVKPDYTDSSQIRTKYDGIVSLNVLNVLEPELRDRVLLDIASRLSPGGRAIIGTRKFKGDVSTVKGATPGPEYGSVWVSRGSQKVYQKGFDGNELLDYASGLLGSGYRVRKLSGPAANNIEIERIQALLAPNYRRAS